MVFVDYLQLTFNPTVVRLGPALGGERHDHSPSFNPTVVRLGHISGRVAPPAVCLFQSHCGAIGTWWEHLPYGVTQDFQSHCGAIGT